MALTNSKVSAQRRRTGLDTFEDLHKAVFPDKLPRRRTAAEMKEGIRKQIRQRRAHRSA